MLTNKLKFKDNIYDWKFLTFVFQADVCHAYQLLVDQGVKPENIVVFMYDDIAFHKEVDYSNLFIFCPTKKDVIDTSMTYSKERNKILHLCCFNIESVVCLPTI
jgi:hypothetical protein